MAIHNKLSDLMRESILEYLEVADYCVNYEKNVQKWGVPGCFGYPATVLLMSIADSIGSYIIGGDCVEEHFKILNKADYYNLNLSEEELRLLYKHHRCLLTHNAGLSFKVGLSIGGSGSSVVEWRDGKLYLNLKPFFELTKEVVKKFFDDDEVNNIIEDSNQSKKILNKD